MNKSDVFNPTPISKFLMVLVLSLGFSKALNNIFILMIAVFISIFFAMNSRIKTAIRAIIFYFLINLALGTLVEFNDCFVRNSLLHLFGVIKLFFLPLLAGNFLVTSSDVSSLIVSFEKMRFPKFLVIPLAVMFRYFPAFKEDKKNIRMAMKMRGITFLNPIKYFEYISVPLLISASNIANDISKSAETKCISDPCEKNRYYEVKFRLVDLIYVLGITGLYTLGRIYA